MARPVSLALALVTLGVAGCASGSTPSWDTPPRMLGPLPERFVPDAGGPTVTPDDPFCLGRLRAPEAPIRLRLVRSAVVEGRAFGDYAVDPGTSYGLRVDELLRVDCGTGRGLGAVAAGG